MKDDYVVALYLRISDEDEENVSGGFSESESISGQRMILTDFVCRHEELSNSIIVEVIDDGYSGTNFERPGIQSLLEMVKERKVNCIVVKDFSRLGRNYLEVGNYLEQIFPFLGVRFMSVNDNFDSFKNFGAAGSIDVGFKNIIYQAYSNDLSIKIKSVRKSKAEQGQFVTAFAPYGFVKAPNNKNKLVADEECALIVCRIYAMFMDGKAKAEIARILNQEEIPSPMMVRKKRGDNFHRYQANEKSHWTTSTISCILSDQRYVGDSVYGKVKPLSVGSEKDVPVPRQEWIVIPNAYESIVDRETFEAVQSQRKTHNYLRSDTPSPLAKKVICRACNHSLKRIDKGKKKIYFLCTTRVNTQTYNCYVGYILEDELEKAIIAYLQALCLTLQEKEVPLSVQNETPSVSILLKIKDTQEKINSKQATIFKVYEAFKTRKTNELLFAEQMAKLESEIDILKGLLLQEEKDYHNSIINKPTLKQSDCERIKKYSPFHKLTKEIVDEFLEAVYVEENGTITIKWKFNDSILNFSTIKL